MTNAAAGRLVAGALLGGCDASEAEGNGAWIAERAILKYRHGYQKTAITTHLVIIAR